MEDQGVQPSERELKIVNEGIGQQEDKATDGQFPLITGKQTETQSLEGNEEDTESKETGFLERNDVASWGKLRNKDRDEIAAKGPPQNPEKFPKDETDRAFPMSIFTRLMPNGESIQRDWLVWSDSCQGLLCFSCCMFNESPPSQGRSLFSHPKMGYRGKWKKLYDKVKSHEQITMHITNYVK